MIVGPAGGTVGVEDLIMIGEGDFKLVVSLLVLSPGLLTRTLLTSHLLVLLHHLLGVGSLPCGALVLKHAAHAKNGLLLVSKSLILVALGLGGGHVFAVLLVSPVALITSVLSHSLAVHCTDD